jgi:hypothetical protein
MPRERTTFWVFDGGTVLVCPKASMTLNSHAPPENVAKPARSGAKSFSGSGEYKV